MISRKDIAFYSKRNNTKAFKDLFLRIILLFFNLYLVFAINNPYLKIVLSLNYFLMYSFTSNAGICHEFLHNNVFKSKTLNVFFFKLFSLLNWTNYSFSLTSHWEHHFHTLSSKDPKNTIRRPLSLKDFLFFLLFDMRSSYFRLKYLVLNSLNIIPTTFLKSYPDFQNTKREICLTARFIIGFHFLLISLFVFTNSFWLILFVNLAPFCFTFLNKIFAISQHFGKSENSNIFYSTRTFVANKYLMFLYANMNYHIEHHLYPSIPYYNLPLIHSLIKEKNDYPSYSTGLLELFKELDSQGLFKLTSA